MKTIPAAILAAVLLAACAPCYYTVRAAPPPLSVEEITARSQAGASDGELILAIDESGTDLPLRTADILALSRAGVGPAVIDHLISLREWALAAGAASREQTGPRPAAPGSRGGSSRFLAPVSIN